MSSGNFIKNNFVLIVGLALPVLLMFGFMILSTMPMRPGEPPKYDLVFAVPESSNSNVPVSVKLVVGKNGALMAQYTRNNANAGNYNTWKTLYLYDAKTQKTRKLSLPYPTDIDKMPAVTEVPVEATKGLKLDTTLEAPDGYTLSYDGYSRSGFVGDLFVGGGGYSREPRLRKGSGSIKLVGEDTSSPFYYDAVEFIGWVTGKE